MKTLIREKRMSKKLLIPVLLIGMAITQVGLMRPVQASLLIDWWCSVYPNSNMCVKPSVHPGSPPPVSSPARRDSKK